MLIDMRERERERERERLGRTILSLGNLKQGEYFDTPSSLK